MKRIKNIAFSALLAIGAFSLVTYTSCNKDEDPIDPCVGIVCSNGGTCISGACNCPVGYEGTSCDTKTRDKFIGVWQGQDVCGSGTYTITLTINSSTNDINALVTNPGGFGVPIVVTGIVESSTTLRFTNVNVGGGRTLSGVMTFSGGSSTMMPNNMAFSYTVTPSTGSPDVCNGNYTRQ